MSLYARLELTRQCDCANRDEAKGDCPRGLEASVSDDEALRKLVQKYPHMEVVKVWRQT